ncbi:PIN domain-containing protein [Vineibacter terrae]|uniref:PIN domain-containing protein n=1 Tax=Vineibacter terrae TaxID=2586908 RepID=UPI002E320809|nr:PIN domain-containing protein [Vineibacter terrae]HEX2886516.1 PIN domain-containing protein [Vineibacter terrae]
MTRVALDSNILVYAELEPESAKGARAQQVIRSAAPRGILAVQTLLEFVAVVRRKRPASLPSALTKVSVWSAVFETVPTTRLVAERAQALVRDHNFQVWDAVIWCAARSAGADILCSEDLQNGLRLDGMRAVNPFAATPSEIDTIFREP